MPATISSLPSTAAPAAQIALSASGTTDSAMTEADAGGMASFAELFQRLAGQQLSANTDPVQMILPAEAVLAAATAAEPTEVGENTLAALMPFLEAMGFTQDEKRGTEKLELTDEDTDASLLAGIATALTPQLTAAPAISAAQPGTGNHAQALPSVLPTDTQASLEISSAIALATDTELTATGFAAHVSAALEVAGDKAAGPSTAINPAGISLPATSAALNTPSAITPALPVEQAVGASDWGQEVGNRIVWMANRMESRAELVLTPPQMGRVEVSLSVSGDQASASFVSANPVVREALEAALPRLREVLAEAGIQLGQAQVGAENTRQSAQQEKNGDNFGLDRNPHPSTGTHQVASDVPPPTAGLKIGRGLVDVFA